MAIVHACGGGPIMVEGTVVNGEIELASGMMLPKGVRVRVEVEDPDDLEQPCEPYNPQKELAIASFHPGE